VVQVTDFKDRTVELRVLLSARNSGAQFDLRCAVREALLKFLQQNYPDSLPRNRVEQYPHRPRTEDAKRPDVRRGDGSALAH
jgi:hypothetical protein